MKYRNLILSVLCWLVASVSLAVTLPSSSYTGSFFTGAETYEAQLGSGVSMVGSTLLSTSSNVDPYYCMKEGIEQDVLYCTGCCTTYVQDECFKSNPVNPDECFSLNQICFESCTGGSRSLPLGSPLLLLPFALAYALIRRRHQASEVA